MPARHAIRRNSAIYTTLYIALTRFLLLLSLAPGLLEANTETPIPARLDSILTVGKQHLYNLRLSEAEQSFLELQKNYAEYPHGFVYQSYVTVIKFSMDKQTDSLGALVSSQVDRATEVAEKYTSQLKNKADGHFYLGIANGIRGMHHVVLYNYVRAYWYGRKAKKNLEEAIKQDPDYADAYLGLGVFHYYAALLPGVVKFVADILGFEGDKALGMEEINLTRYKGRHFRFEAEFVHHTIRYFFEGDKAGPIAGYKSMYKRYPENHGFAMLLAYHYRRIGQLQICLQYCRGFRDEYLDTLPLIANAKYYNMAIAHYDLNNFARSDSLFDVLIELPTRKSQFYQAAIDYYKGHLADLRQERDIALAYYQRIPNEKQSRYWYMISSMARKYPYDSLMTGYVMAKNLLFSKNFTASMTQTQQLMLASDKGARSVNPDFSFLLLDLLGQNQYYVRNYEHAGKTFDEVRRNLGRIKDPFQRAWIQIHINRCYRELGRYQAAKKMLDEAQKLDEEFTRIIIARERFLLESKAKKANVKL